MRPFLLGEWCTPLVVVARLQRQAAPVRRGEEQDRALAEELGPPHWGQEVRQGHRRAEAGRDSPAKARDELLTEPPLVQGARRVVGTR